MPWHLNSYSTAAYIRDPICFSETQDINKTCIFIFLNAYFLQMSDKVEYWLELSEYDLETAEALLKSKRFIYVGFMCHQTIEKIFKAYYIQLKKNSAPYSHSLSYIAKKGDFYSGFDEEQKEFIDQLEPLNIETRYPINKERLLKSLNDNMSRDILNKTRELQEWIKTKL